MVFVVLCAFSVCAYHILVPGVCVCVFVVLCVSTMCVHKRMNYQLVPISEKTFVERWGHVPMNMINHSLCMPCTRN